MRKSWYSLLIILVAVGAYLARMKSAERDQARLDSISRIYLDGDLDTALSEISVYLGKYPEDDLAWTVKGNILQDKDLDAESKQAYERALSINPGCFHAINALGVIYRKQGDDDKAMECYEKALQIEPGYAEAYSSMAVIELRRDNDGTALEYARLAYQNDNEDPVIAANLAVVYHYNGMTEERDRFTKIARNLGYRNIEALESIYRGDLSVKDE